MSALQIHMRRLQYDFLSCTRLYVDASFVLVHANVSLPVCLSVCVFVCVFSAAHGVFACLREA